MRKSVRCLPLRTDPPLVYVLGRRKPVANFRAANGSVATEPPGLLDDLNFGWFCLPIQPCRGGCHTAFVRKVIWGKMKAGDKCAGLPHASCLRAIPRHSYPKSITTLRAPNYSASNIRGSFPVLARWARGPWSGVVDRSAELTGNASRSTFQSIGSHYH